MDLTPLDIGSIGLPGVGEQRLDRLQSDIGQKMEGQFTLAGIFPIGNEGEEGNAGNADGTQFAGDKFFYGVRSRFLVMGGNDAAVDFYHGSVIIGRRSFFSGEYSRRLDLQILRITL